MAAKTPPLASVMKALTEAVKDPQVSEIASHAIHLMGGPQGFAKNLMTEYKAAKAGSVVRMRILEFILRATKFANEAAGITGDLGLVSEADLERIVTERIDKVLHEPEKNGDAKSDPR